MEKFQFHLIVILSIVLHVHSQLASENVCLPATECGRGSVLFRAGAQTQPPPNYVRFYIGFDVNLTPFQACRANVTGPNSTWSFALGKGYSINRVINGFYFQDCCWVAGKNGTEMQIVQPDKIQFMLIRSDVRLLWISKRFWNDISKLSPAKPISVASSSNPASPKLFLAKTIHYPDDESQYEVPAVVYEGQPDVATVTYNSNIYHYVDYQLLFCMNDW